MDEITLNDFMSSFDGRYYPEAFLAKYEIMECLAQNQMGETLLVKDRFNTDYIAKCYTDTSLLSQAPENELLKKLHHSGLPEFVEEFQTEKMLCVVRKYAKGIPLSQLEKPLAEPELLQIGVQLCDILTYLHGQRPPVIHRDIKPQNIVMDESGKITLIDFGISREYDESARADTVFFGTQEFAPPEQYGFSQTDNRADIFSLGVVLAWLLTGRTSLKAFRIRNRRLEHIIRKCTAFAPQNRYRDAKQVRK
jgi:serine/threonine protein kinase